MIVLINYINPISGIEDTIKLNNKLYLYSSWLNIEQYNNDNDITNILDKLLKDLDCTRVYNCGRPMQTKYSQYNTISNSYYYYISKLSNQFTYNQYIDKYINNHCNNLLFEFYNPVIDKKKSKSKSKTVVYKTKDLFTNETIYYHDNIKKGTSIRSKSPVLKDNKVKRGKSRCLVPLDAMTFSFKKK